MSDHGSPEDTFEGEVTNLTKRPDQQGRDDVDPFESVDSVEEVGDRTFEGYVQDVGEVSDVEGTGRPAIMGLEIQPVENDAGFPEEATELRPSPEPESQAHSGERAFQQPFRKSGEFPAQSSPGGRSTGSMPRMEKGPDADPVSSEHAQPSLLGPVVAAALISTLGCVTVAYFAVTRWMSQSEVTFWAVAGVLVPAVVLGAIVGWPADRSRRLTRGLLSILPGLVLGGAAVGASFLWSEGSIRSKVMELAPDDTSALVESLRDDDPQLAAAACLRLASQTNSSPESRQALLGALTVHPSMSLACLGAVEDSAVQQDIAATLAGRWHRQLLTSGSSESCAYADALDELPVPRPERTGRLLGCLANAESADARVCCRRTLAQSLGDNEPARVVTALEDAAPYLESFELVPDLIAMSFHRHDLSKVESDAAEAFGFHDPAVQRQTLSLACESVRDGIDPTLTRHLAASLPEECEVDPGEVPRERAAWVDICIEARSILNDQPNEAPSRALCRAAEASFVNFAVATASKFIHYSWRSNRRSALSEQIDAGYAHESEAMSPGELAEIVGQHRTDLMRGNVSNLPQVEITSRKQLQKMMESGKPPTPPKKYRDATEMFESGAAKFRERDVEQYKKMHKQMKQEARRQGYDLPAIE